MQNQEEIKQVYHKGYKDGYKAGLKEKEIVVERLVDKVTNRSK